MNTTEFGGTFWQTAMGLIIGFLSGISIYCLKSKCKRCSICYGMIQVHRDIESEIIEEQIELEKGLNPYSINNK